MGFVDSVKEFAEKVGDTVDKGIKTGSDGYKKMTEKSRLKKETARLNNEVNAIFISVGKAIYSKDPYSKEFRKQFEAVKEKNAEIERLNVLISALEDKVACKQCGEMVSKDSKFCDKCGSKIDLPVPEPETVQAEEVYICKSCGAELIDAARFCDKCGAKLDLE